MDAHQVTRRGFVGTALGAGLVAAAGQSAGRAAEGGAKPMRLGGPSFAKTKDPEELALAHRKLGYRAAYCPNVGLDDAARIRDLSDAFAKHDVVIAEVGRWCNLLDADAAKRKENLRKVTDGLALADAIGARCCVDIAGSYNEKVWYGPDPKNVSKAFFDATVENARKIIDAVKPRRAKLCLEMMGWALPDSADSYLELIKAVDRPGFGAHLDVCNLINSPRRFYDSAGVINECFDKLGRWITSCHAKDLKWNVEMNVHFVEVTVGTGSVDEGTLLRRLSTLGHDAPLMLEHCPNAEEYDKGRRYLLDLAGKLGLSFG
ncbi:MAG: sugar phosphate isomerase/epimerase [Phycisphaerae bacterium]|nr:sugar phosphate isomerase/epimerase [Phycisphaerae bacterium]